MLLTHHPPIREPEEDPGRVVSLRNRPYENGLGNPSVPAMPPNQAQGRYLPNCREEAPSKARIGPVRYSKGPENPLVSPPDNTFGAYCGSAIGRASGAGGWGEQRDR